MSKSRNEYKSVYGKDFNSDYSDSGKKKIDITQGLGLDWGKFNGEVFRDKFDRKVVK